jgi:hypothetical protein
MKHFAPSIRYKIVVLGLHYFYAKLMDLVSFIIREYVNQRRTDKTMTKRKSTKGQKTINKTSHIKLKIE